MRCLPSTTMPPPTPVPQKTPRKDEKSAAGPEAALGVDRDVDVVADHHRPAELVGERRPERVGRVPTVDVRDLQDRAGGRVDRARGADADPLETHRLHPGFLERRP